MEPIGPILLNSELIEILKCPPSIRPEVIHTIVLFGENARMTAKWSSSGGHDDVSYLRWKQGH